MKLMKPHLTGARERCNGTERSPKGDHHSVMRAECATRLKQKQKPFRTNLADWNVALKRSHVVNASSAALVQILARKWWSEADRRAGGQGVFYMSGREGDFVDVWTCVRLMYCATAWAGLRVG